MIVNNKLKIFENFEHISRVSNNNTDGIVMTNGSFITSGSVGNITLFDGTAINAETMGQAKKKPIGDRLREFFFNPIRYFKTIKKNVKVMNPDEYIAMAEGINKIFQDAQANGQTSLLEKMENEKKRIETELRIIKNGYDKYILEEDIVNFSKNSARKIKLDWIKNFVRLIPDDIQKKVHRIEKTRVFDNYVILHYDPEDTGTADTKAEVERKKDPIIFGVCDCSRRLYYIGDWIDEHCDLTLDKLLKGIGETENTRKLTPEKVTVSENDRKVKLKAKKVRKRKAKAKSK
jgi:hypothetical protein